MQGLVELKTTFEEKGAFVDLSRVQVILPEAGRDGCLLASTVDCPWNTWISMAASFFRFNGFHYPSGTSMHHIDLNLNLTQPAFFS